MTRHRTDVTLSTHLPEAPGFSHPSNETVQYIFIFNEPVKTEVRNPP